MKNRKRSKGINIVVVIAICFLVILLGGSISKCDKDTTIKHRWSRQLIEDIEANDIERMESLIAEGYDVDTLSQNPDSVFVKFEALYITSPLEVACQESNYEAIRILLKNGANPNSETWYTIEPLYIILTGKMVPDKSIVRLLLEYGANPNYGEAPSYKPIMNACLMRKKVAEEYITHEDLEAKLEVFKILESYGADIYQNSGLGDNVLMLSARQGNLLISEYLLTEKDFDINQISRSGRTALIGTIYYGDIFIKETVELLLEYGADVSIKNNDGKTAYDYAVEKGYDEIAEMIKPD